jgi:MFS family permease
MLRNTQSDSDDVRDASAAEEPPSPAAAPAAAAASPAQRPPAGLPGATSTTATDPGSGAYGREFWFAYANNACLMMAVSLLFRYADFVKLLGGTEWHLGWIVGVGMVGSLLMRLAQGMGIDRYGSRAVWILSVTLFTLSCASHLLVVRVDGPFIFLLRIVFATSVAGAFGASITFISRSAPILRVAEVVGTLGTSGFVAMISGTMLGDWICGTGAPDRARIDRLFMVAAALGLGALVFAVLATRDTIIPPRRRKPHILWVLRRYHPGWVLLIGVAMGFGISLPHAFVRPFVATLNLSRIGEFFLVYSVTAFVTRILIRRLPERIGIRPMILWGMASLVASILSYLLVKQQWELLAPAVLGGIAHAILFPAVVAGGSGLFPARHRGVGTTLMLATFDLGNLVGAPTAGGLLMLAERHDWPPYPAMFMTVAILLTLMAAVYAVATWGEGGSRKPGTPRRAATAYREASRR